MPADNPSVAHIVYSIGPSSFGLGAVAASLASHQASSGLSSEIWCLDDRAEALRGCRVFNVRPESVDCYRRLGPRSWCFTPQMERACTTKMRERGGRVSVVHQHGIWTGLSRVTRTWQRTTGLPTVVAAHGALNPLWRGRSSWKKRLALLAYERDNLQGCSCLHALTAAEADQYREFGLTAPIAIIPNGIAEDWIDAPAQPELFYRRLGVCSTTRLIVYIGRIASQKGLAILIDALATLRSRLEGWKVVIAGIDQAGYQRELQRQIERLHLGAYILFPGPTFADDKRNAFAAADLFVLPSCGEAFPMALLEALGAGVPVLTTTGIPISELQSQAYGWHVPPTLEGMRAALEAALGTSRADLHARGTRGVALVRARYMWHEMSTRTAQLYRWLLDGGPAPRFVSV